MTYKHFFVSTMGPARDTAIVTTATTVGLLSTNLTCIRLYLLWGLASLYNPLGLQPHMLASVLFSGLPRV